MKRACFFCGSVPISSLSSIRLMSPAVSCFQYPNLDMRRLMSSARCSSVILIRRSWAALLW